MATCKDCIHYEVCQYHRETKMTDNECFNFKDKSRYIEVVRCKDCISRGRVDECAMAYRCDCGEQHTWECDNDFCSYGLKR